MSVTVDDLFSPEGLDERVAAGLVRVRSHPSEPLLIANYTSRAAYERVWDEVTRTCRSLVWHRDSHEVVARPFVKFFDLHETNERVPDGPPVAHEKLDGSLGILYRVDGDGWSVATRGSFVSAQAGWATQHLRGHHPDLRVPAGITPLVEIVYPENRIVVAHSREALVLLGAIDNRTGADVPLWEIDWWPGPRAEQHVVASAHDGYLHATSDTFAEGEGLVLAWYRPGRPSLRVKVKHPRYVELHRIVTATSARDVWRSIVVGDWRGDVAASVVGKVLNMSVDTVALVPLLDDILEVLPDDLRHRVVETADDLRQRHADVIRRFDELWAVRPGGDRRAFALWAGPTGSASLLFGRLDDRAWQLDAWAQCRPDPVPLFSGRFGDAL